MTAADTAMTAMTAADTAMTAGAAADPFAAAREVFEEMVSFAGSAQALGLDHATLEDEMGVRSRELTRRLYQDHLDLRAVREERLAAAAGPDGRVRTRSEPGHSRQLATVFGQVEVVRVAYRGPGLTNFHPADAELSLPAEKHSLGVRRMAAEEACRGSFADAAARVAARTGSKAAKRQVERLTVLAAEDFDAFYAARAAAPAGPGRVLVLQADGKGVVMRPDALRAATAKAAAAASPKLGGRLSKGEKRCRKRMAEVGAVHWAQPAPRAPADVLPAGPAERASARPGPKATGKWVTASVAADAATVIGAVFDEACRRDPAQSAPWVALVDGANHQIDRIEKEAAARHLDVTIICDFVHVVEYLWKAAWCFFDEGDPAAESWVRRHGLGVLEGRAPQVAANIRRSATARRLAPAKKKSADKAADYLRNKSPYLDYPQALANGWPIATGVIEGACRHLVADRLDITGARWGLDSAEAVLRLRALKTNADLDEYWEFHKRRHHHRTHGHQTTRHYTPAA
jgi:hypothetical protein